MVEDWSKDGGVLLMGYEMYRLLSMKKSFVMGKKRKSKKPTGPVIIDLDEEDRQQELMKGPHVACKLLITSLLVNCDKYQIIDDW